MNQLRGNISGLAIPYFCIDAPGGGGKIPLLPKYVLHQDEDRIILRNYKNEIYTYQDVKKPKKDKEEQSTQIPIEVSNKKNGGSGKPKKYKDKESITLPEYEPSNN